MSCYSLMSSPVIRLIDGKAITTSRSVADYFGKQHKDVLRRIDLLAYSSEFTQRNFAPTEYQDAFGKKNTEYQITREGFTFLAMGFTGEKADTFKEAYIAAFNDMESQLAKPESIDLTRFLVSFDVNGKQQVMTIGSEGRTL